MSKGYSKEIMEALFKEEQENQKKAALDEEAKKKKQYEDFLELVKMTEKQNADRRITALEKKIKLLQILLIVTMLVAIFAASAAFGDSLKVLMSNMPY